MSRIARKAILEDYSFFHITWKCHNNDFLLRDDAVKQKLYDLLLKYKKEFGVQIFGYCFMDNHPHIVGYCESVELLSQFFQVVNSVLARFINKNLDRRGQVMMDRFHSPQIESERHLLHVLRYTHLNPVRAGICSRAQNYRWSSARARIHGTSDPLLDPLPEILNLDSSNLSKIDEGTLQVFFQNLPMVTRIFFLGSPDWIRKKRARLRDLLSLKKKNRSELRM